ncbi:MAG: adenosylmethionine--8-amino-7-oxononanoate transaminase [Thermodesulfobacteriota bacterium]
MARDLLAKDRRFLWHPYTQMQDLETVPPLVVDRALGLFLYDPQGRPYFDAISSWWCILHGHNHPHIRQAVARQLERLPHTLLAGVTHEPAVLLAEQLVAITPPRLTRVFFSDNGSTACEVAIKMALQYRQLTGQGERRELVALARGYHGDTIGTMGLGGVPEFHAAFSDLTLPVHRLPSPDCYRCPAGERGPECSLACLAPFAELLAARGERLAAVILEPLIQAAGGMIIHPPRYLARLVAMARQGGLHVILDEVATGFGRTGRMFALEHAGVEPDLLCLSKGLTAGFLPMGATLASEEIYQAFYGDYRENRTFYHGHTYTGNPLAARAALASLEVFAAEGSLARLAGSIPHLAARVERFRELPWVGDVRQLGMIVAMELVKDRATREPFSFADRVGWAIHRQGLAAGLFIRPLGHVVYLWLPISTTWSEIDAITDRLYAILADPTNISGWPGGGRP